MAKRAIFVGRFCPFHKGHLTIMKEKIKEGVPLLIFVRDTSYDIYSAELRKKMIEQSMEKMGVDCKVMIIDDMESINYGRGVGYQVNEIEVDEDIKSISATDIRQKIDKGEESWKDLMPDGSWQVLEEYLTKKGTIIWFTGLPFSGKSTIANALGDKLKKNAILSERLDSNMLREIISEDLDFSKEGRHKNIRRAAYLAKLLARNGAVVLASFITPYESLREEIREDLSKESNFVEVYVKASLDTCKKRDDRGIYKRAAEGKIKDFTGVSDRFDEPKDPKLVLDTEKLTVEESINKLMEFFNGKK